MTRKLFKTIVPIILVLSMVVGMSLSANAFTTYTTHIIDNDDAQGYSNEKYGFDNWFQASTLYYQDARKQVCNSDNNAYVYKFPKYYRYTTIYGQISAYLYNINFTDPSAAYYMNDYLTYAYSGAGYINQDLAATGWNVIGTATTEIALPDGFQCTSAVEVWASQDNTTKYCGADAIKITLGY